MCMLCVRGPIEVVRAFEECTSEHDRRCVMASRAKHQMNFDVHWPGYDHPAAQDSEEPGCELMPPSLGSIARRDEGSGVADDQSVSRDSTSSTRRDRSGSSSMMPAYGSGPALPSIRSVTTAENDLCRRFASRVSRTASDAGIEIVRRTAGMSQSMNSNV